MAIDIAQKIQKAGLPVKGSSKAKDPVARVCCSECGGEIRSDDAGGDRMGEDKTGDRDVLP